MFSPSQSMHVIEVPILFLCGRVFECGYLLPRDGHLRKDMA